MVITINNPNCIPKRIDFQLEVASQAAEQAAEQAPPDMDGAKLGMWMDGMWVKGHPIPSGKRLHSYGKSPFLMGKSTINSHFQ